MITPPDPEAQARAIREMVKTITGLSKSLEGLDSQVTNSKLDTFRDSIKGLLKTFNGLDKVQIELIDTYRDAKIQVDKLSADFKEWSVDNQKFRHAQIEGYKKTHAWEVAAATKGRARDIVTTRVAAEAVKHTDEYIQGLRQAVPALETHANEIRRGVTVLDRFNGSIKDLKSSTTKQIAEFASLAYAASKFKQAFIKSYEQMNLTSSRGMLGAMGVINEEAFKLHLTFQDFAEILGKNRDIVNALGGGTIGIRKFSRIVDQGTEGLEMLGRHGAKASAAFFNMAKNAGFVIKEDKTGKKIQKEINAQWVEFSSKFEDTPEMFASMVNQLTSEETTRRRLNSLNEEGRITATLLIIEQAKLSKTLGLSTEQLVAMNQKLGELYNPRKLTINDRFTAANQIEALVSNQIATLKGQGNDEEASKLENHQGTIRELTRGMISGWGKEQISKFQTDNQAALSQIGIAQTIAGSAPGNLKFKAGAIQDQHDRLIPMARQIIDQGDTFLTADIQAKNIKGRTDVDQNAAEMAKANKALITAFNVAGDAVIALQSPFADLALGVTAAAGAIYLYTAAMMAATAAATAAATVAAGAAGAAITGVGIAATILKYGGKALKGASALGAVGNLAYGGYNAFLGDTESKRNSGTGQVAGTILGGALGFLVPLPGAALVGAALGGAAGNYIGERFGDKSSASKIPSTVSQSQTPTVVQPQSQTPTVVQPTQALSKTPAIVSQSQTPAIVSQSQTPTVVQPSSSQSTSRKLSGEAQYAELISKTESANGIPPGLLTRLLRQESGFSPDVINGTRTSKAGALGIAQFMPATARELGINPLDPNQAIPASGKYLAGLKNQTGDWNSALASYNWGIGNFLKKGMGAAPKETRDYVAKIGGGNLTSSGDRRTLTLPTATTGSDSSSGSSPSASLETSSDPALNTTNKLLAEIARNTAIRSMAFKSNQAAATRGS